MDKITHQVHCEQWTSIINECLASGMNKTAFVELTPPAQGKVPVSDFQPDMLLSDPEIWRSRYQIRHPLTCYLC